MRQRQVPVQVAHAPDAARLCLWFYLSMLSISLVYILITRELNGDFYGVPVSISDWEFTFVALISFAPYLVGYQMYRRFTQSAPAPTVRVGNTLLGSTFFVVTMWFIFLAMEYDVGVLGRGLYDAPSLLKPFIQITNRINPFYLGAFFIAGYQGSKKTIILGIFLMITLGILRAGLGVFMYVLLALVIRNHQSLRCVFRRHFIRVALFVGFLPIITTQLYVIRGEMRGSADINIGMSAVEIVAARLVGRMSSISNTVFIFEKSNQFRSDVRALDPMYFQRQALAPLFGVGILPEVTPERLLINMNGSNHFDVSFMTGVPGNLTMAWFIHPLVAQFNASTMILLVWLSFFFANKLDLPYRNEVCLMIMFYPLTSGVGTEFSFIVVSMVALIILFKLLRLIGHRDRNVRV